MATTTLSSSSLQKVEDDRTRTLVAAVKEVALALATGKDARREFETARAVIERTDQQEREAERR